MSGLKTKMVGALMAIAIGLTATASGAANAVPLRFADADEQRLFLFGTIDRNHDGIVTHGEYQAYRNRLFTGSPDRAPAWALRSRSMFESRDINGDGLLLPDEFRALPAPPIQRSRRQAPVVERRRPHPAPEPAP